MTEIAAPTTTAATAGVGLRLAVARTLPAVAVAVTAFVVAWEKQGSLRSPDWLPAAVVAALILATVLLAGAAVAVPRAAVLGLAGLLGLSVNAAVAIAWSPSPSGARDEALLALLYAVCFAVGLAVVRSPFERMLALELIVVALAILAVVTAIGLIGANDPESLYFGGRLNRPISYPNATALLFALGFWPAVAIASRRRALLASRVVAAGAATLFVMLALAAQSKGTLLGLIVSAIVVFAIAPYRLRFAVPCAVTAVIGAVAFGPLTEPYRATTGIGAAIHHVGVIALVAAAVGCVGGLVHTLVDRRLTLSDRTRRRVGIGVVALVAAAVLAGLVAFLVREPSPDTFVSQKWSSFKHVDTADSTSTHLLSLGSNRYDIWRVALHEFAHHPIVGIGSRGFYSAYLRLGRSDETPLRAHSLYFDTLAEDGLVGAVLLALALGGPLVLLVRGRRSLTTAAILAAAVVFLVHAGVDWMWTVAPVGMLFFVLVGLGCAGRVDEAPRLHPLLGRCGAIGAGIVALLLFAPPWIADRYVVLAYRNPTVAPSDLRWARRLDPLSLDPFFARWRLATTNDAKIAALRDARAIEPDNVPAAYQLGVAELAAGDRAAARAALQDAVRLAPRDRAIAAAFAQTKG